MRYSNGFYVFNAVPQGESDEIKITNVYERWEHYNEIANFNCYHYLWFETDSKLNIRGFHEAPVWVNQKQGIIIIFSVNYFPIPQIINGIRRKFKLICTEYKFNLEEIRLFTTKIINGSGNIAFISNEDTDIYSNGLVATELMKSDEERINLIESLISEV